MITTVDRYIIYDKADVFFHTFGERYLLKMKMDESICKTGTRSHTSPSMINRSVMLKVSTAWNVFGWIYIPFKNHDMHN